jgi:hypothetical protein
MIEPVATKPIPLACHAHGKPAVATRRVVGPDPKYPQTDISRPTLLCEECLAIGVEEAKR